jgi:hypothetical protein
MAVHPTLTIFICYSNMIGTRTLFFFFFLKKNCASQLLYFFNNRMTRFPPTCTFKETVDADRFQAESKGGLKDGSLLLFKSRDDL